MNSGDDDFRLRPGRVGNRGKAHIGTLAGDVRRAATKAGFGRRSTRSGGGPGHNARGRRAALQTRTSRFARRVVVKARILQHKGTRFRAASIARHIYYLEREGVTRDGGKGAMFDAKEEIADTAAFAKRCENDRHHFRFTISPEDAGKMADLRAFTRELMADMERDLGTKLDWLGIDHYNTDNPHIQMLVRGVAEDGRDLVIARDYISGGIRARAQERATWELGPRSQQEIAQALDKEMLAERWTSLDRSLKRMSDENAGVIDLRPAANVADRRRLLLLGRAAKLESLGLARQIAPACWTLRSEAEATLRDLAIRNDVVKTLHKAMSAAGRTADVSRFALHPDQAADPVIGRLVDRGLHDELSGRAYAIVEGADGRTHHLRFADIELTGDAKPGAIVELRTWEDAKGRTNRALAVRSDLPLDQQVTARGATWLDRQLIGQGIAQTGDGFGQEIRDAVIARAEHLAKEGLVMREGGAFRPARGLIETLRSRDLHEASVRIMGETGLAPRPKIPGEPVSGIYRTRLTLASGRFAMIDDGLGFMLVPWRPALDAHLGQQISGIVAGGGGIDWTLGRSKGLSV
ncbi:MAG: relaxase/mobilization nuclease domain-containing protein [Hyphomonadaceae bacterium]